MVITLTDPGGRTVHAVLLGVADDSATLRVGNVDHVVPLAALARVWRGEFATLWRVPPGYRAGEAASAAGGRSSWLAQQLAARVFAFQLAQGLEPDGLAGPLTLMKLNRASGVDEPRLLAAR